METQTWELVGKKGDLNFLPAPTVARGLSRPVSSSRRGRSGAEKRWELVVIFRLHGFRVSRLYKAWEARKLQIYVLLFHKTFIFEEVQV